jgi:cyclopropane-fatty-acyl-phospholipid synthase
VADTDYKTYKRSLKKLLDMADIKIDGKRPEDIVVHDNRFYQRALGMGSLGIGESYMDGWWDCKRLDTLIAKGFEAHVNEHISSKQQAKFVMYHLKARIANRQAGQLAYKNAQRHYDIGNDLYEPMLGETMAYTCAYWEWGAKDLDEAQRDKFELICKKLGLKKGMKVLDVGCGWGGLSMYMAREYGCKVVCFTPAKEQVAYIKAHTKGLNVKPVLTTWEDYDGKGKFDRIAAIGVTEHIGPKNYSGFLAKMRSLLVDDGLFLLHTIGGNKSVQATDVWMDKYIFPNAVLPSVKQLATASEGKFVMEDWHNLGPNYDKTLLAWNENFQKSYPSLDHDKYDERFKRMWEFYLLVCAGLFRSRYTQLWQIVYSPHGVKGGYKSVR